MLTGGDVDENMPPHHNAQFDIGVLAFWLWENNIGSIYISGTYKAYLTLFFCSLAYIFLTAGPGTAV
jgi:hypothetical protein